MRYLSVCSGIEAATVAWHPLDWVPVAFSEIEKFPSAVLEHHYPQVRNLGDMTTILERGDKWLPGWTQGIDVLVGGTPCQAFSVAGLRKSLEDDRGNLSLAFVRLADGIRPRFVVWENVPGVLSTGDNAFGCFLGALAGHECALECPGERWGDSGIILGPERAIAWRCLDAQYFGLAQRRKRVFVVACPRDGADPAEVLFEREGVRRDTAPSREAGEGVAGDVAKSIRGNSGGVDREDMHTLIPDVANPLTHRMHKGINTTLDEGQTPIVSFYSNESRCDNIPKENVSPPLKIGSSGSGQPPAIAFDPGQSDLPKATEQISVEHTPPVIANRPHAVAFKPSHYTRDKDGVPSELTPPLSADADKGDQEAVIFQEAQTGVREYDSAGCLRADGPGHDPVGSRVRDGMQVRRLTPRECERLQGFPDDYTQIPWRGKPAEDCPDGPRYRALGNSMAVPVMRWIGERIAAQEEAE